MTMIELSKEQAEVVLVAISWAEEAFEDFDYRYRKHPEDGYTEADYRRAYTQAEAWRELAPFVRDHMREQT